MFGGVGFAGGAVVVLLTVMPAGPDVPPPPTEPPATAPPVTDPPAGTGAPTTAPATTAPVVTTTVDQSPVTTVGESVATTTPAVTDPVTDPPTTTDATATTATTATTDAITATITTEATTTTEVTTTTVAPPVRLADGHVTRSIVFPVVGGWSFGSGWNDVRENGERYHHGADIIASDHQVIVSPVSGRIANLIVGHPTIGSGIVIVDDDGYRYDLYHLPSARRWRFAGGLEVGDRVSAGQLIGFVGGSGAAFGNSHVHFELRRPNGVQINPYWSLDAASHHRLICAAPESVTDDWADVPGAMVSPDRTEFVPDDPSVCRPVDPPLAPEPPPASATPGTGRAVPR